MAYSTKARDHTAKKENPEEPAQCKGCGHPRQETGKDSANTSANLGAAEEMSAQKTLLEKENDSHCTEPSFSSF